MTGHAPLVSIRGNTFGRGRFAAVVFAHVADRKAAQVFTLVHELALAEHFRVSSQAIVGPVREAGASTWDQHLRPCPTDGRRGGDVARDRR